jgi:hypothetical protein
MTPRSLVWTSTAAGIAWPPQVSGKDCSLEQSTAIATVESILGLAAAAATSSKAPQLQLLGASWGWLLRLQPQAKHRNCNCWEHFGDGCGWAVV